MAFRSLRCRFVSDKSEVDRLLYIRQSEVSASDDEGRTLSVVGIPAFLQDPEVVLEGLFAGCGSVERVVVHPSQVGPIVPRLLSARASLHPSLEVLAMLREGDRVADDCRGCFLRGTWMPECSQRSSTRTCRTTAASSA